MQLSYMSHNTRGMALYKAFACTTVSYVAAFTRETHQNVWIACLDTQQLGIFTRDLHSHLCFACILQPPPRYSYTRIPYTPGFRVYGLLACCDIYTRFTPLRLYRVSCCSIGRNFYTRFTTHFSFRVYLPTTATILLHANYFTTPVPRVLDTLGNTCLHAQILGTGKSRVNKIFLYIICPKKSTYYKNLEKKFKKNEKFLFF